MVSSGTVKKCCSSAKEASILRQIVPDSRGVRAIKHPGWFRGVLLWGDESGANRLVLVDRRGRADRARADERHVLSANDRARLRRGGARAPRGRAVARAARGGGHRRAYRGGAV